MAATPTPTQIPAQIGRPSLSPIRSWVATKRVIPAMMAPATLPRMADCRPASLPPQWKKQPQAIKAAQIASMPPSGPRKSQVAMAPSTPTLIASAVFADISPPFLRKRERADPPICRQSTGSFNGSLLVSQVDSASGCNYSPKWCHFEQSLVFCPINSHLAKDFSWLVPLETLGHAGLGTAMTDKVHVIGGGLAGQRGGLAARARAACRSCSTRCGPSRPDRGPQDRRAGRAGLLQLLPLRRMGDQRGRPAARGDAPGRLADHGGGRREQAAGRRRARGRPRRLRRRRDGGARGACL